MSWWKQLILSAAVAVLAFGAWIAFVPAARPMLERVGIWAPLESAGVIGLMERVGLGPEEPATGAPRGPGGPPGGFGGAPTVAVAAVVEAEYNAVVTALGSGQALRSLSITPETSGRLVEILVQPGQRIEAGAVIARLDADAERIAVDRARLTLADARDTVERRQRLQGTGAATELQIRDAATELRQAELALEEAELELRRRTVLAPFSGTVGFVSAEVGDQVTTSSVITRLDDRSALLVEFLVPERFVGLIAEGTPLVARPLARPGLVIDGRIRALDNRVDVASRSLTVQAEIENPDDLLRAGMAFSIEIALPGDRLPAVDPLAIQWNRDGAFVWALREGRVMRVPVRIVERRGDLVLVQGELSPGESVVREGVQMLRPGLEVEIRGEATAAAARASET